MSLIDELPKPTTPDCLLDHAGIMALLPHRYPFLLVDRVLECEPGKSLKALKCVSFNEPWTQGHFPQEPVFPGVLQVEALAQAVCILVYLSYPEVSGKRPAFAGIDNCRFRRPVRPGDVLTLEAEIKSWRRGIGNAYARILVGDKVVCETDIMATMV
jgi:beta-hydroxyacyl-ACP dehydratase FabZ